MWNLIHIQVNDNTWSNWVFTLSICFCGGTLVSCACEREVKVFCHRPGKFSVHLWIVNDLKERSKSWTGKSWYSIPFHYVRKKYSLHRRACLRSSAEGCALVLLTLHNNVRATTLGQTRCLTSVGVTREQTQAWAKNTMDTQKAFLQDSTNLRPFTTPGLWGTLFGTSGNPGWDDKRWVLSRDPSDSLVNDWSPATTPCLSSKHIKVSAIHTNRATRLSEVTLPLE